MITIVVLSRTSIFGLDKFVIKHRVLNKHFKRFQELVNSRYHKTSDKLQKCNTRESAHL